MSFLFRYRIKNTNGVDHTIATNIAKKLTYFISFGAERNTEKKATIKPHITQIKPIDANEINLFAHNLYFLRLIPPIKKQAPKLIINKHNST